MFEGVAPNSLKIPWARLNKVLDEAGMADESFVCLMVADLKDTDIDKLFAHGAIPRENQDKMLQYLMRVDLSIVLGFLP